MKLSILICTIPSRKDIFHSLYHFILSQSNDEVEILFDDSMDYNRGKKRNLLLDRAKGDFVVFIDDDDEVSDKYVPLILNAISQNPKADCIGIQGIITENGKNEKQWYISIDYGRWYGDDKAYYRTPNHISPIKRELAVQIKFPEIDFGEDSDFSNRIFPLLKVETKINENIYHYKWIQK